MERVAYQKNLPLIDVRDEFLAIHNYRDYLCLDGIHLNEQGQKVMADIFQSYAMIMHKNKNLITGRNYVIRFFLFLV